MVVALTIGFRGFGLGLGRRTGAGLRTPRGTLAAFASPGRGLPVWPASGRWAIDRDPLSVG